MVVEPTLQGRGIAGQLMGLTIEEIKRRVRQGGAEEGGQEGEYEGDGGMEREGGNDRAGRGGDDDDVEEGGEEKEKGKNTEILLMLSSLQELNESYYQKRGWSTTNIRRFPKGTMGSQDGFGVVEMMKVIPL